MTRGRLVAAAHVALLTAACGREDVLLDTTIVPDAVGSPNVLPDGGAAGSAICTRDAGASSCIGLGDACTSSAECCSARCASGTCLPGGACLASSAPCTTRDQCCSGRCEPITGTTNRACAPLCRRDGEPCARAQDCCSLGCSGGRCTPTICGRVGDACASPSECCSGICEEAKCRTDSIALCRATGEDCTSGGGAPCCSTCVNGRCDVGSGACRPRGAPCTSSSECCGGACNGVCSAPCVAAGGPCAASDECCAGSCSATPGVCQDATLACLRIGQPCSEGKQCCTGACLGGRCADDCGALR